MSDDNVEKFLMYLLNVSQSKRQNAAYAGRMDDDGAQQLEDQIAIFRSAKVGKIPDLWNHHFKEFQKINDPDWQTYHRLKAKFKD